jgi:2-aminomuconate deaminase
MEGKVIEGRPRPRGKYPHFKRAGDFIFVSGTTARRPDDTFPGVETDERGATRIDIRAQTRAVLESIRAILRAADADLTDCVRITTYLTNMKDFAGYNEAYGEFFDYAGPARATVGVSELAHPHAAIEIEAVAYKPEAK